MFDLDLKWKLCAGFFFLLRPPFAHLLNVSSIQLASYVPTVLICKDNDFFLKIWYFCLFCFWNTNLVLCSLWNFDFTTSSTFVLRYAIWYPLYNLKNVKNTHGGVLPFKSNTPPWVFFTFFKLYKGYQIHGCFSRF